MTSALDTWPPTDATAAQPYDQRGCCWPWGKYGPGEKLPMRYLAIGVRDGGPVGATWGRWVSGQLLQVWLPSTSLRGIIYHGGPSIPLVYRDTLHIDYYTATSHWFCNLESVLDIFGNIGLTASGVFEPPTAFASFDLAVSLATGAADPPDRIHLTPLHWYDGSIYPYLGP